MKSWTSADGTITPIVDLTDSHISNIISFMKRKRHYGTESFKSDQIILAMETEQNKRKYGENPCSEISLGEPQPSVSMGYYDSVGFIKPCNHAWVEVGFVRSIIACKHCGVDKPVELDLEDLDEEYLL